MVSETNIFFPQGSFATNTIDNSVSQIQLPEEARLQDQAMHSQPAHKSSQNLMANPNFITQTTLIQHKSRTHLVNQQQSKSKQRKPMPDQLAQTMMIKSNVRLRLLNERRLSSVDGSAEILLQNQMNLSHLRSQSSEHSLNKRFKLRPSVEGGYPNVTGQLNSLNVTITEELAENRRQKENVVKSHLVSICQSEVEDKDSFVFEPEF